MGRGNTKVPAPQEGPGGVEAVEGRAPSSGQPLAAVLGSGRRVQALGAEEAPSQSGQGLPARGPGIATWSWPEARDFS